MARILTGLQSSGDLHWGNFFGAIQPMLQWQQEGGNEVFLMIADYHACTTLRDPKVFGQMQKNSALDFLALGIDPEKTTFFRQSDVPEHAELFWLLSCSTSMGLLQRAHAFKDKSARGIATNAGLFVYPVLMAADILLYNAEKVPVGPDQKQHLEMAREIAEKFNRDFGPTFVLPEYLPPRKVETIAGLDGQKMSKSYGNTIEIFADFKSLQKKIGKIKTDSVALGQKINPEKCPIFALHELFQTPNIDEIRTKYLAGEMGFGDSKKILADRVWNFFAPARERRDLLEKDETKLAKILENGAEKARQNAKKMIQNVREKMGFWPH